MLNTFFTAGGGEGDATTVDTIIGYINCKRREKERVIGGGRGARHCNQRFNSCLPVQITQKMSSSQFAK